MSKISDICNRPKHHSKFYKYFNPVEGKDKGKITLQKTEGK